jgi:NAD(P)-dependent dehydrogenase (short-subunit alcohol dehydrogenase family)
VGTLDGRVAIVTGAGRGIGAAVAKLFASEGAAVVVNDIGASLNGLESDGSPGQDLVRDITASGGTAKHNGADISDHAAARDLVESTIKDFGKLDVLVNVAGILRDRMIFNMSEEEWDAVIRVHLKGHFNTIRPAAAYWRGLGDPNAHHRIINYTSRAGLHGAPGQPNYSAAKLGIVGLTYSCAVALRKYGVTTNAITRPRPRG